MLANLNAPLTLVGILWYDYLHVKPVIEVPLVGRIRGSTQVTETGDKFYSYWAIPYARSPTGKRRFAPPEPKPPLNDGSHGEYDATVKRYIFGTRMCPQNMVAGNGLLESFIKFIRGFLSSESTISEDCLHLSIFTKDWPGSQYRRNVPVFVYVHGGAFYTGSYAPFGPEFLMEKDIVLVYIQYRLGPFGFLCFSDNTEAAGNMGLQDQILALQWIQKHISAFGGDPTRVTLMGESAGSASAALLMSSPRAVGLFHRVIGESGSAFSGWAIQAQPQEAALDFAKAAGCPTSRSIDAVRCLKYNRTMKDLIKTYTQFRDRELYNGRMGQRVSAPCVQTQGEDKVLDRHPTNYSTLPNSVPAVFGANRDEGSLFLAITINRYLSPRRVAQNTTFIRTQGIKDVLCGLNYPDCQDETVVNRIVEDFFNPWEFDTLGSMVPGLMRLFGTLFIFEPTYDFAKVNAKTSPTYFYSFEYSGKNSLYRFLVTDPPSVVPHGVTHGDELLYLYRFLTFQLDSSDRKIARRMVDLWTDFGITGAFGGQHRGVLGPINPDNDNGSQYLVISTYPSVSINYPLSYTKRP